MKTKKKIERVLYFLSEYVYRIFSTIFSLYLLAMATFYCLDIEINIFFRDLFFLLLGLWIGSGLALSATSYMKKNHKELDKG